MNGHWQVRHYCQASKASRPLFLRAWDVCASMESDLSRWGHVDLDTRKQQELEREIDERLVN